MGCLNISIKLVNNLKARTPAERGISLRSLINSQGLIYRELVKDILRETGDSLLEWLEDEDIGLTGEEGLRIMSVIKRSQGKSGWFELSRAFRG